MSLNPAQHTFLEQTKDLYWTIDLDLNLIYANMYYTAIGCPFFRLICTVHSIFFCRLGGKKIL
jgi:hypothetical protein